jgi:hypothetical protein
LYSNLDRLLFLGSFLVLMNWGVRLTQVVINGFF